jgi:hypothetical protein
LFSTPNSAQLGVKRLCRVIGVSVSGFYAFLARPPSPCQVADAQLAQAVIDICQQSRRT